MAQILDLKNNKQKTRLYYIEPSESLSIRTHVWSGPLHTNSPNLKLIFIFSGLLFTTATLVQIYQKNIITTIFFCLLGFVILLRAKKRSGIGHFEINPLGMKVNDQVYDYRDIKSFWIEYNPAMGIKELSLQLKKWYLPYIKIPLSNQNPVQLRSTLIGFLPEIEHKDTLSEIISRKLGI